MSGLLQGDEGLGEDAHLGQSPMTLRKGLLVPGQCGPGATVFRTKSFEPRVGNRLA